MKHLFFEEWKNKRVKKIIDIFGKNWFKNKTILELGAAHGDVGIEFLKLGADVTFSDVRIEHLESIAEKLKQYNYTPKLALIDQNNEYDFGQKFDLVIHMGVLYHVHDWKNDLKHALSHSDIVILESALREHDVKSYLVDETILSEYDASTKKYSGFTQESVELELKKYDCKFLRIDDPELNCQGYFTNHMIYHKYDWKSISQLDENADRTFYRRMWLILK